jgi:transcriptional regulator with XRE-family HTH domain
VFLVVVCMEKLDPYGVGLRVRALLKKTGLGVEGAAELLEVGQTAVRNWTNGYNMPTPAAASELVKTIPGLTLDWIYLGDDRLLPQQLARELQIILEAQLQGLEVPEVPPEPDCQPARSGLQAPRRAPRKLASANG